MTEKDKHDTATTLARARAADLGDQIEVDGHLWTVAQATSSSPLAITYGVTRRNVKNEEDVGFWTWAIVEVLRHSGVRIEELLEMTHLALQPYTIKPTGETIPLLHIPPSKNDEERMLVASPELVHVLTAIIKRIRHGREAVPLTQRWDPYERVVGDPLPHLFVKESSKDPKVLSMVTVHTYLNKLAKRANLRIGDKAVNFTPHDFRRLFATEALAWACHLTSCRS